MSDTARRPAPGTTPDTSLEPAPDATPLHDPRDVTPPHGDPLADEARPGGGAGVTAPATENGESDTRRDEPAGPRAAAAEPLGSR